MWCEPCWHWLDIPYVIIVYVWYNILINIYMKWLSAYIRLFTYAHIEQETEFYWTDEAWLL